MNELLRKYIIQSMIIWICFLIMSIVSVFINESTLAKTLSAITALLDAILLKQTIRDYIDTKKYIVIDLSRRK